jgi:polyisoprenoid-binding protein YceI
LGYLIQKNRATSYLAVALFAFLFPSSSFAQILFETKEGKITFISEAPLENITATSNKLKGIVNFSEAKFAFSVDIKSFDGFNGDLQREHFNENYLETSSFPTATFSGKLIDPIQPNLAYQTIRAKGTLDVHGVKHERILSVMIAKKNNGYTVNSTFQVPLANHGISVPRIVYQKIAESISVTLEAQLVAKP